MQPFKRLGLATIVAIVAAGGVVWADNVANPGTNAWVEAARTGRADMLILGDSLTLTQGNGWDAGFINAAQQRLGLAGTGLMQGIGGEGDGYSIGPMYGSAWSSDLAAVRPDRAGYVWRGYAATAGSAPLSSFYAGVGNTTLSPNSAYQWNLYTASPDGGGTLAAYRRSGTDYHRIQTLSSVSTQTPANGLQHIVLDFAANTDPSASQQMFLENTSNTTIFYSRLIQPGATGTTVTSWGYGGKTTLDFLHDQWLAPGTSQTGRAAFLSNLVDGGSGKLNVLIAEGFNDRNESDPSVHGITPGNSPAAFADNMQSLIAQVRSDWAAAGLNPGDLSFTLVSEYKDYWEAPGGQMSQFALQLENIARNDPAITYVDLYDMAPDYQTAVSLGYMYDSTHFSREGALAYSGMVMNTIVPEPHALGLLVAGLLLLRRRRGN